MPCIMPTWPMCSTPPITNTSPCPVMICAAAACSACMDEPHSRFTVWPATWCGRPASSSALRPMFMPCSSVWFTQPQITSSTSFMSAAGLRLNSALISSADSTSARTLRNMPPFERPMAVRTPSMMTTSRGLRLMFDLSRIRGGRSGQPKNFLPDAAMSRSSFGAS